MESNRIFIYDNIPPLVAPSGVARYFRHFCDGVSESFGSQATIFSSKRRNFESSGYFRSLPTNFRGSKRLGVHHVNDIMANWLAKQLHSEIFYSPYYGYLSTKAAQVYTVYDMIHELKFPRTDANEAFINEKLKCFERATLLLSISQSTANDIINFYPHINPQKIVTIWLGVEDFFFNSPTLFSSEEKPYFLYVGARKGYKNFIRLLRAFGTSGLAKEFDLRVISPDRNGSFCEEEILILNKYHLGDSVDLRLAVSEQELCASYSGAEALVFPSEYEGFGLPVLEAMAAGTIVAAANIASIPEIAGDQAYYFDPFSEDSIADAMLRITLLSEEERQSRIYQGVDHARKFSWERCQKETSEAISQLL